MTDPDPLEIFLLNRDAAGLANEAFFDPSMMGLLYFVSSLCFVSRAHADRKQPDEHKFAVYTPLFGPIALPMIITLIKEILAWLRRRRAKRIKPSAEGHIAASDVSNSNTATTTVDVPINDLDEGTDVHLGAEPKSPTVRLRRIAGDQ